MFPNAFTVERHIEELRAELRAAVDPDERADIQAELVKLLAESRDLAREMMPASQGN